MENGTMTKYTYGDPSASHHLIQMIGDHDLAVIENEVSYLQDLCSESFYLIALKVDNWNEELSPWKTPAVFGKEDFGEGAKETLEKVLEITTDRDKHYFIGGYSLAGLFALWASCQTDVFIGVAAASPSIWFPGFVEYMKENPVHAEKIYLSLGKKEEKTRHPLMSTVGDRIREGYEYLKAIQKDCVLEWNPGNHFKEPDMRMAKAFAWVTD